MLPDSRPKSCSGTPKTVFPPVSHFHLWRPCLTFRIQHAPVNGECIGFQRRSHISAPWILHHCTWIRAPGPCRSKSSTASVSWLRATGRVGCGKQA